VLPCSGSVVETNEPQTIPQQDGISRRKLGCPECNEEEATEKRDDSGIPSHPETPATWVLPPSRASFIPAPVVGMDPFLEDELTDAEQDRCDSHNDVDHAFGPSTTNLATVLKSLRPPVHPPVRIRLSAERC
jgi:hypothetical protein